MEEDSFPMVLEGGEDLKEKHSIKFSSMRFLYFP